MGAFYESVIRRWLEVLLPLYSLALLTVYFYPQYLPSVFAQGLTDSPLPWVGWAVVGAMSGILALWVVIVGFFLLYSPAYLLGKSLILIGRAGWVDPRELRFYVSCFLLLCFLLALAFWNIAAAGVVLILLSGWGPVFWRHLI